jgi:hypothetical protein
MHHQTTLPNVMNSNAHLNFKKMWRQCFKHHEFFNSHMPLILGHLSIHTKFLLPIITMGFNKDHCFSLDSPISFNLLEWLYLQVFLQLSMWLYLWLQASSSKSTYLHFLENFALFATSSKLKVNIFSFFKELCSLCLHFFLHLLFSTSSCPFCNF